MHKKEQIVHINSENPKYLKSNKVEYHTICGVLITGYYIGICREIQSCHIDNLTPNFIITCSKCKELLPLYEIKHAILD